MTDLVNHPGHYTDTVPGIECIDVTQHFNFNRGNAIKYLWRAGAKGDAVEDLRKAGKYIEFEIARLEAGRAAEQDAQRAELVRDIEAKYAAPQPTVTFDDTPLGPPGPSTNVILFPPPGERWHE